MIELEKKTQLSWRKFLSTEDGIKGLLYLRESEPSIAKGETHGIVFDAGKVEGYKLCLEAINQILTIQENKEINPENP